MPAIQRPDGRVMAALLAAVLLLAALASDALVANSALTIPLLVSALMGEKEDYNQADEQPEEDWED